MRDALANWWCALRKPSQTAGISPAARRVNSRVAPEFVEKMPPEDRAGPVFKLSFRRKDTVVKVLSAIGANGGVVVDRKPTADPEKAKLKYASAHVSNSP